MNDFRFVLIFGFGDFARCVSKFLDDVSRAAVGPIFNGNRLELQLMIIEYGTYSGSRNAKKFTLHKVQDPQNQNPMFIPRWKSKIKNSVFLWKLSQVWAMTNVRKTFTFFPP
jgi:hypothetical protein